MTLIKSDRVRVRCFRSRCGTEFIYVTEFPERDVRVACVECALKLGDHTMYNCWHCGAQFQSLDSGIFMPESCSKECQDAIDEGVERVVQHHFDAIEVGWRPSDGYPQGRGDLAV
jgi:DNA-directed RNA polymerase subunit RPC12/RpoP